MPACYCTLFDSRYLTRGLALYESLKEYSRDFHLYIFPFNKACLDILHELHLQNVTLIPLSDFETEELLSVKPKRSLAEYCWTCTPHVIHYVLKKFNVLSCTYLDADLFFYNDPAILNEEMKTASILITEHRYTKEYDQADTSGKYCVQYITFKNDPRGLKALEWWKNACLEWCYARFEYNKFGDQKYLDDWTERFEGVHVLEYPGGGIAPWNVQQYEIHTKEKLSMITEKQTGKQYHLIFYHFHDLKFYPENWVQLTGDYALNQEVIDILYVPYLKQLRKLEFQINLLAPSLDPQGIPDILQLKPLTLRMKCQFYWSDLLKTMKIFLKALLFVNLCRRLKHHKGVFLKLDRFS
ncbi:MAG: glycosyl transferase [Candidatus Aureabacteria bacterium]|nr:glycosyl transferase [Candidatus Auribacterota bacterium]